MTPALSIRDLKKTYKGGHVALKGVSFDVAPGDFFALLGPNGAGKTTIIGIITSLVNRSSGSVSIFGHDPAQEPAIAKACLGLVPQEFNFHVRAGRGGRCQPGRLLRHCEARTAVQRLPEHSIWDTACDGAQRSAA
jgi:ABC-type Mn2+/Zn2+ transport system ATPase subunit